MDQQNNSFGALIVEDNRGDAVLFDMQLKEQSRARFEVQHCDTLAEARVKIEDPGINVVILDLGLPDSSGLTTIRELGSSRPDVPIVAVTGSNDPGLAELAIESGAEAFLVKGKFEDTTLANCLLDAIEKRRFLQSAAFHTTHDPLTRLPNRVRFMQKLGEAIDQPGFSDKRLSLHTLDINGFKTINAQHGDEFGDKLLIAFADRLRSFADKGFLFARIGSDEFAVFESRPGSISTAEISSDLANHCHHSFTIDDVAVELSVTVGSAIFGVDGHTPQDLLVQANLALRSAKREGISFQLTNPYLREQFLRTRRLLKELESAVSNEEITMVYQPILSVETEKPVGFEALARWSHPEMGPVPPSEFIAVAENSGLIDQLGVNILKQALRDAKLWRRNGHTDIAVSVNISVVQLQSRKFVEEVFAVLKLMDFPASGLEFEITETVVFRADLLTLIIENLKRLQSAGIKISIDDFGTGNASLSYLQKLSYDTIKIDQEFVQQAEYNATAHEIARAITGLGHTLGKKVVAEGVETKEQFEHVKKLGCDLAQGFYFQRPVPIDALLDMLPDA